MKLALCLLLISSVAAMAATEEQLNKKFTVQPGGKLRVDVDIGSIKLDTNGSGEVAIDVWRKATRKSKADEEAFLKDNPVTFTQEGDTVTIRCHRKAGNVAGLFSNSKNRDEARYTITVPTRFNAELKTEGGGISASGLTGSVEAGTSGGGLDFAHLSGPLDGKTSGGGIQVDECAGALQIRTSGGGIRVTGGSGSLSGDTSGGGVAVRDFRGAASVRSSGGGLEFKNVAGAVEGATSGGPIEAVLSAPLAGDVTLRTSGGGVTVNVAGDAAFNLDASTSGGGVTSDLPVTTQGKPVPGRLKGPVNGGGPAVTLRSSGGGISILKR